MFVFIVANLPLPIIFYLNLRVWWRSYEVWHLKPGKRLIKPERLLVGFWLNNTASIFAYGPSLIERQIFVQHRYWLISYAIAATLSISGLILMNSGLGEELAKLQTKPKARLRH